MHIYFSYFIPVLVICNLFIIQNYAFTYLYAQTDKKDNDSLPNTNLIINELTCDSPGNPSALTIETDKARYIQDQIAKLMLVYLIIMVV